MNDRESYKRELESMLSDFHGAFLEIRDEVLIADRNSNHIDADLESVKDWTQEDLMRAGELVDIVDSLQGEMQRLLSRLDTARDNLDAAIGDFQGFLDDEESLHGKYFNEVKVLGALNWIHTINYQPYFVCSIGNPKIKKEVCERAEKLGYKPITIIHPSARVYSNIE